LSESIADALLLLAVTLGLDFSNSTLTIEERLDRLLTKLAALEKPCLLVIDNANEPNDFWEELVVVAPQYVQLQKYLGIVGEDLSELE
jgi:hypothetical protein